MVASNDRGEVETPGSEDCEAGKLFKVGLFLEETAGLQ